MAGGGGSGAAGGSRLRARDGVGVSEGGGLCGGAAGGVGVGPGGHGADGARHREGRRAGAGEGGGVCASVESPQVLSGLLGVCWAYHTQRSVFRPPGERVA